MMWKRGTSCAILLGLLVAAWNAGHTAQWQPYQFGGNERFVYRISWSDNGEMTVVEYEMATKGTGEKGAGGEEIFEVSYTTRGKIAKSDLNEQAAFGLLGMYGISLPMLFLNPMYGAFFGEIEFEVGEKMSLFGMGVIKVTDKVKVAGRDGYVCQLFAEDELQTEWTIDPKLPLPLWSKIYEDGEIQHEIELLKYEKY
jgi:hypothetical protein